MIKFKEFNTQPYDVHIPAFLKKESENNPDDVFEYVDLKVIDTRLVILIYRQTNKAAYQLRSLAKSLSQ
ncbi:hypothetical protein P7D93_18765 [Enterococcus raffinosus]|uniref:hypothetical protein n=1 Tax=Enterococcus raffinosus TaxID=71452 RepID=UPI00288E2707|nr:hypothetical protein [Enterococcus raffinosus]MDT2531905.1 hypothetical protein [Enterococcus raffinosus]